MKLLHLYAQPFWHSEAYVVGNRAGLETLRDAINRALEGPVERSVAATPHGEGFVTSNDGEGYQVFVIREDSEYVPGSRWSELTVPYTEYGAGAVEHFVSPKQYQELTGCRR